MRLFIVILLLSILPSACKKEDSPGIDKAAIIGKWKLKSLNRTVEYHQYHNYLGTKIPAFSQIQKYTVDNEILDIKWHTDYLDDKGNIVSSSDAILDNFETHDKTVTELHRIFTLTIEFSEGYSGIIEFVSKKTDGTIVHSGYYENNWNWLSRLGTDEIWLEWDLPRFISSQYIYDLRDDKFVIRGKVIYGVPELSYSNPQYTVDENEVIFERVK